MYIKSLTINGFKSFAEKTILDFVEPKRGKNSITAIVGPNGSGKSNVSDAIRWVLGEQSMKQLRGKKSEDIIFSGSEYKGQLGSASVTLILDNTDKRIPIEYDEIVITRRIYRSGESEYILNGNEVRLFDLQLLLAKGQFGQGSYSIIGQGMIDRLILQSTEERKNFFDEAVGIKEFQLKRHQAVLKLVRTKEHVSQAELLLGEISPRLKTLKRQVQKLEERQEIEVELREAQEVYFSTIWSYNNAHIEGLKKELDSLTLTQKEQQTLLDEVQEELAHLARESSRERFDELQKAYQDVMKQKGALEKERAMLLGKLQTEYSKAGKQNIGWIENKIGEVKNFLKEVELEKKRLQGELTEAKSRIKEKEISLGNLLVEKTQLQNRVARLEQEILNATYQQSIQQFTGLRAVEEIRSKGKNFGLVYGTVSELASVDPKYQTALDVAAGNNLSSLVVDTELTGENCIRYLREKQLGYATFLPISKIRGRFVAQDLYELLDRPGVHGFASELADYDKKFDEIFSYILGNTLIVDDIQVAREIGIGRVRMVTLDGDILEVSGAMKGGYRKKRQNELSFGSKNGESIVNAEGLQDELHKLKEEYSQLVKTVEESQSEMHVLESQIQILSSKLEITETQRQTQGAELSGLEQELALSDMTEEDFGVAMGNLARHKAVIDDEIAKLDGQLEQAKIALDAFNDEEEKKKRRVFELQDTMQNLQTSVNKIVEGKNTKQVELARFETKQEDVDEECYREIRISVADILERGVEAKDITLLDELQSNVQKLKYKLQLIGGIDEEVVAEYEEIKARHDSMFLQLEDLQKAVNDLEILVEELDSLMKKKRDKAFKQITKEFKRYFSVLFDGGNADLVEVYGEVTEDESVEQELLEEGDEKPKKKKIKVLTGIDIIACPPGKKIKNIQALSGGERTMTAIALVCAVLHTNPPPFVLLDEVEAALDEANTLRFTKILDELAEQSQFILITHNRATMHSADALYGVTMGNEGISKLLSVKLEQAEQVVEK